MVQELLVKAIRCDVCVDGSFVTAKLEPGDVDVTVVLDADVHGALDAAQEHLIVSLMENEFVTGLDTDAVVRFPRGHKHHDNEYLNAGRYIGQRYGVENSGVYLKGYVVIPLGENDVGLRIRSW